MPPSDVTSTTIRHPGNPVFGMLCIRVLFFLIEFIIFCCYLFVCVFVADDERRRTAAKITNLLLKSSLMAFNQPL